MFRDRRGSTLPLGSWAIKGDPPHFCPRHECSRPVHPMKHKSPGVTASSTVAGPPPFRSPAIQRRGGGEYSLLVMVGVKFVKCTQESEWKSFMFCATTKNSMCASQGIVCCLTTLRLTCSPALRGWFSHTPHNRGGVGSSNHKVSNFENIFAAHRAAPR